MPPPPRRRRRCPVRTSGRDRERGRAQALATRIDLGAYLQLGEGELSRSGPQLRPSILAASAFEAVAGALLLDIGWAAHARLAARNRWPGAGPRPGPRTAAPQEPQEPIAGGHPAHDWRTPWGSTTIQASGPDHEKLFRVEVAVGGEVLGLGVGPSRRTAELYGGGSAPERRSPRVLDAARRIPVAQRRLVERGLVSAPARLLGLRVQGFKSFAERTLVEFGPRDQRDRGTQRVGQVQSRGRPPLGPRRAGPVAPDPPQRGRDLGRFREAKRAGHGGRDPCPRQRGCPVARRIRGRGARPAPLPVRRERLPAQPAAGPAARPG